MRGIELVRVTFVTSLLPTRKGRVSVLYARVVGKIKRKSKTIQKN